MTWYIQRKQLGKIETIDEIDDRSEAYKLAAQYNMADKTAYHYVQRRPCKAWLEREFNAH